MLDMRPNCECCGRDLVADESDAFICSFECTFCESCTRVRLAGTCPNCGGELVHRPTRNRELWDRFPPSRERIQKPAAECPPTP